jgi:hypothetical protein
MRETASMPYTDLEQAIDIQSLTLADLDVGPVLVKSDRKGYLRVTREGDAIRVSSPWRNGSAVFYISSVPIGNFVESELSLPFLDLNIPAVGISTEVTDCDSRN